MATARTQALAAVRSGNVIYGITTSGQQKLLLVYEADRARIRTRHVTTGEKIDFDRDGQSLPEPKKEACRITSTAGLSNADHETMIGLDRKMRRAETLTDLSLSNAEINLLLAVHDFFRARPLPEI